MDFSRLLEILVQINITFGITKKDKYKRSLLFLDVDFLRYFLEATRRTAV